VTETISSGQLSWMSSNTLPSRTSASGLAFTVKEEGRSQEAREAVRAGFDFKSMKPLWSTVVATGRKPITPRLTVRSRKHAILLPALASNCRKERMVRRGVNGSSPLEGFIESGITEVFRHRHAA
jgi:hypothetical protein